MNLSSSMQGVFEFFGADPPEPEGGRIFLHKEPSPPGSDGDDPLGDLVGHGFRPVFLLTELTQGREEKDTSWAVVERSPGLYLGIPPSEDTADNVQARWIQAEGEWAKKDLGTFGSRFPLKTCSTAREVRAALATSPRFLHWGACSVGNPAKGIQVDGEELEFKELAGFLKEKPPLLLFLSQCDVRLESAKPFLEAGVRYVVGWRGKVFPPDAAAPVGIFYDALKKAEPISEAVRKVNETLFLQPGRPLLGLYARTKEDRPLLKEEDYCLDRYRAWAAADGPFSLQTPFQKFFPGQAKEAYPLQMDCLIPKRSSKEARGGQDGQGLSMGLLPSLERPEDLERRPLSRQELFGEGGPWLLEGEAGAGKTTLLRDLAQKLDRGEIEGAPGASLWISLGPWGKKKPGSLLGWWAERNLKQCDLEDSAENKAKLVRFAKSWLSRKKAVLLLDGLDELPEERELLDSLENQIRDLEESHVVVTRRRECRRDLMGPGLSWRRGEVRLLGKDEVPPFLEKYLGEGQEPKIKACLDTMAKLGDLARTPLFVTVAALAALGRSGKEGPPGNINELLERAILNMLDHRLRVRTGKETPYTEGVGAPPGKARLRILARAFWRLFASQGEGVFEEADLLDAVQDSWSDDKLFTNEIKPAHLLQDYKDCRLLVEGEEGYRPAHTVFFGFLCAWFLAHLSSEERETVASKASWKEECYWLLIFLQRLLGMESFFNFLKPRPPKVQEQAGHMFWLKGLLRKAAEFGIGEIQVMWGSEFRYGVGRKKNPEEVIYWYKKAAEQGNANGQVALGEVLSWGEEGFEQNYAEAKEWFLKGAENGSSRAMYRLGYMYEKGKGVAKCANRAVEWYRKAAERGHLNGQVFLADMLVDGIGVEQDFAEAAKWYRRAAEKKSREAMFHLGVMYEHGQGVVKSARHAVEWYRKAAGRGHLDGQVYLADMLAAGIGADQGFAEAANLYVEAAQRGSKKAKHGLEVMAENGIVEAQFNLGLMYLMGRGLARDCSAAVKWWRKAAEKGNAGAYNNLGCMYTRGLGVDRDDSEAVKWFLKAAEIGSPRAQANIGLMFLTGRGVGRDEFEAVKWLRKAALKGERIAQYFLGQMYKNGRGVRKNDSEGDKWLQIVAASQQMLGRFMLGKTFGFGPGVDFEEPDADKVLPLIDEPRLDLEAQVDLGILRRPGRREG